MNTKVKRKSVSIAKQVILHIDAGGKRKPSSMSGGPPVTQCELQPSAIHSPETYDQEHLELRNIQEGPGTSIRSPSKKTSNTLMFSNREHCADWA